MADISVMETGPRPCTSQKCGGRTTRHNLVEITALRKETVREWICTECLAKTAPVIDAPAVSLHSFAR